MKDGKSFRRSLGDQMMIDNDKIGEGGQFFDFLLGGNAVVESDN